MKGGPFGDMKKFPKNFLMRFLNSVTVPKNVKGGTLCDCLTSIVLQNIKKNEGGALWGKTFDPKSFKKSHSSEKKLGSLVCFRGFGRLFCFFFSFGTLLRLELLRFEVVEVVEQMNKKWTFRV